MLYNSLGIFIRLTVVLCLIGCRSASEVEANQPPLGKRYAIGQGGGFSGAYTEFILSENGMVHKYDFKYDREVFFKTLGTQELVHFLEKIEALGLEGMEVNQPGNLTKYIDVRYRNHSVNKVVWGNYNYQPDKDLVKLHQEMFEALSTWD